MRTNQRGANFLWRQCISTLKIRAVLHRDWNQTRLTAKWLTSYKKSAFNLKQCAANHHYMPLFSISCKNRAFLTEILSFWFSFTVQHSTADFSLVFYPYFELWINNSIFRSGYYPFFGIVFLKYHLYYTNLVSSLNLLPLPHNWNQHVISLLIT